MIVDSKDKALDDLALPTEAPPAYDELDFPNRGLVASSTSEAPTSRSRTSFRLSRRSRPTVTTTADANAGRNVIQKLHRPTPSFVSSSPRQDKPLPSTICSPKAQADVRETVKGLVRDMVQGSSPVRSSASAALGVLESCAAACSAHSISFARILQERSIEHHAPMYWAIVSRPPYNEGPSKVDNREDDAFLVELVAHAAPLALSSVSELRAACLVASNNALFQRLRSVPGAVPLSGTDRMLLQSTSLPTSDGADQNELEKVSLRPKAGRPLGFNDIATVREGELNSNTNAFGVDLQLKLFQRRMRVSGSLEIEFIARGRLWQLIFFVVPQSSSESTPSPYKSPPASSRSSTNSVPPAILAAARHRRLAPGSWALALAFLEASTQCYVEARFIVSTTGKMTDPTRSQPASPGHSTRYATLPTTLAHSPDSSAARRPTLFSSSSSSSGSKPPKRSFFRRTASEDKTTPKTRAPIVLNLFSPGTSPLMVLPTPARNDLSSPLSEELDDFSPEASGNNRRITGAEKRAARAFAAKQQREREGRETRKDLKERARLAESILLVGFEEVSSMEKGRKKDEVAKPEELMYDGCPYISPDGTLRASLEACITNSPLDYKDTDCVVC